MPKEEKQLFRSFLAWRCSCHLQTLSYPLHMGLKDPAGTQGCWFMPGAAHAAVPPAWHGAGPQQHHAAGPCLPGTDRAHAASPAPSRPQQAPLCWSWALFNCSARRGSPSHQSSSASRQPGCIHLMECCETHPCFVTSLFTGRGFAPGLAARILRCRRSGCGVGSPTDTGTVTPGARVTQPLAITVFRNLK